MTEYQAKSLERIVRTVPVNLPDSTDNEIWQTDRVVKDNLVFYFPKHFYYENHGSTSLPAGRKIR